MDHVSNFFTYLAIQDPTRLLAKYPKGPDSKTSTTLETHQPNEREMRIKDAIRVYDNCFFPHPNAILTPDLNIIKENEDNSVHFKDLVRYLGITGRPKFITLADAIKARVTDNQSGVPDSIVGFTKLLSLLEGRYKQILNDGLEQSLLKTIDPSTDDFENFTKKYASLTGFPQDVIKAIWWRENLGRGNRPSLHKGTMLASGDGAMAPNLQLYYMACTINGVYRYNSGNGKFTRALQAPVVSTLAFPADNRIAKVRTREEIIVTPIPTDLVKDDCELNLITGLILYRQALATAISDPIVQIPIKNYKNCILILIYTITLTLSTIMARPQSRIGSFMEKLLRHPGKIILSLPLNCSMAAGQFTRGNLLHIDAPVAMMTILTSSCSMISSPHMTNGKRCSRPILNLIHYTLSS